MHVILKRFNTRKLSELKFNIRLKFQTYLGMEIQMHYMPVVFGEDLKVMSATEMLRQHNLKTE